MLDGAVLFVAADGFAHDLAIGLAHLGKIALDAHKAERRHKGTKAGMRTTAGGVAPGRSDMGAHDLRRQEVGEA